MKTKIPAPKSLISTISLAAILLAPVLAYPSPAHALGNSAYEVDIVKTLTNDKILPTTYPITSIGSEINITAAAGEYMPASFVVHTFQGITGMQANPTALTNGSNSIPASNIDISYVKVWYQSGVDSQDVTHTTLAPELLLKDPNLVKVNLTAQTNSLRNPDGSYTNISDPNVNVSNIQPQDATTLQTVDIPASQNQQYWITVLVPTGTPAGTYQGTINLTASNVASTNIPIKVTVLPFALEKSPLTYSIYYLGTLTQDGKGSISDVRKSAQQYEAEMRDMKAHGVEYPNMYQNTGQLIDPELKIRAKVGLPTDRLYEVGYGATPAPYTDAVLQDVKSAVQNLIQIAKSNGYGDVYIVAMDEYWEDALAGERPYWNAIHATGAKVFAACYHGAFELMGDILDLAVLAGPPDPQEAVKYHSVGHQIFDYANPHVGIEQPDTYRRNYGLLLWKAGYDGYMDYAYQAGFGNIRNDFDNKDYRDYAFAYPTTNGVIDTIQWEGLRGGVDDTRYVATLQKAIATSTNTTLKTEAQNWLNSLNTSGDLDTARATMIDYTTRLKGTNPLPPALTGDLNSDSLVNATDFNILKSDFLKLTANLSNSRSDIDGDGQATIKDVGILMSGWK